MKKPIPFNPPYLLQGGHAQTIGAHIIGNLEARQAMPEGAVKEELWIKTEDSSGDQLLINLYHPGAPPASNSGSDGGRTEESAGGNCNGNASAVSDDGNSSDSPGGSNSDNCISYDSGKSGKSGRSGRRSLVLLVHGLEGSSSSPYMINISRTLLQRGFHVAQLNLRGCGRGYQQAVNCYNAGLTIDIESAVQSLSRHLPAPVALVGFSLGANLIIKFLGEDSEERGRQLRILGGAPQAARRPDQKAPAAGRAVETFIAVSPPLDLKACCERIDSPACRVYRRRFLNSQKARAATGRYNTGGIGPLEVGRIRTFFDFDDLIIAPTAGFQGAGHYYRHCSSIRYVQNIAIPGLLLHSQDDPMIPWEPWERLRQKRLPSHISLQGTAQGGHVAWLAKRHPFLARRRWLDYRILRFLEEWRAEL